MDILNRYLAHIDRELPAPKRADIAAEIADELRSQCEERETTLGRPLTDEDIASILHAYGSPRLVAGRYAAQQYLIGPELLPFYWYALKMLIATAIGLLIVGSAVRAFTLHDPAAYLQGMAAGWEAPIWIVGAVTVIFVLLERSGTRLPQSWDPRRLSAIPAGAPVSRIKSGFEWSINILVALLALAAAARWPFLHRDTWQPIYIATLASCSINTLALSIVYIAPERGLIRLAAQTIGNTMSAVGLIVAIQRTDIDTSGLRPMFAVFLFAFSIAVAVGVWQLYRYAKVKTWSTEIA